MRTVIGDAISDALPGGSVRVRIVNTHFTTKQFTCGDKAISKGDCVVLVKGREVEPATPFDMGIGRRRAPKPERR